MHPTASLVEPLDQEEECVSFHDNVSQFACRTVHVAVQFARQDEYKHPYLTGEGTDSDQSRNCCSQQEIASVGSFRT
ncbi:hypothetical protein Mapa_012662 [Marchantia paleacea]|nr:hypothetical protein Mapa_012662 [Marchantia paleacea]